MSDTFKRPLVQSVRESRISRRALVAGSLALSTAAVGGVSYSTAAARQNQSFSGKFRINANTYNPSESMEKSPDNPIPHDNLQDVINEYQQMYPDVEIETVRVPPGTESRVWTVTQLTGDTAPEIVWTQSFDTNRDMGKGWWVTLDSYMEEPNPYVEAGQPGSAKWIDQFFEGPTAAKYAPDGHIYVVPYDLVTTFFFYNKPMFEQAGVEVPTTYVDFIDVLAKLQDAGLVPYNGMRWSRPQLGEMVLRATWVPQIQPSGLAGAYTQKDITLAILDGVFDATKPEYKDWLRLMKDSVAYWSDQWTLSNTPDWGVQMALQFTQNRLAILEDGSWRFGLLKANDELNFEWGSFFMPTLTQGTGPGQSEFADGQPAPAIGGATAHQFGVTKTAEQNGNVDLVVDFLRFITAPPQASEIIGELGQFLPNIKGVDVNQDLAPALEAVSSGVGEAGMIAYGDKIDAEAAENIDTAVNNYLLGRAELDETAEEIQNLLMEQAERVADEQGWR
ncbi:MAG: ABC transporter substrate-binding protein [Thermomicrobiales bacterium]